MSKKLTTVYLSMDCIRRAEELGDGNVSAGIRAALGYPDKAKPPSEVKGLKVQGRPSSTGWSHIRRTLLPVELERDMAAALPSNYTTDYAAFVVTVEGKVEKVITLPSKYEVAKKLKEQKSVAVADLMRAWLDKAMPMEGGLGRLLVLCKLSEGELLSVAQRYL